MTLVQRIETPGCGCDASEHLSGLTSIDEALGIIGRHAKPVAGTETVPLMQAFGRVLAEPVHAVAMTPPFDNAAMDGYAVDTSAFAGSGPWRFPVASRLPAGSKASAFVGKTQAARIFTGAPVPRGADAVIRQEDARRVGDTVTFEIRPTSGLNLRRAGSDMQAGQVVVEVGTCLGPRDIAACAAAGAELVTVRRLLRVGLLVTGNEVRTAGTGRDEAQIWDVNTPMLCGLLRSPQIELVQVELVSDSRDALMQRLSYLSGAADLIVTTGGVSVGEEDHVKPAFRELGAKLHFSGVRIKPGKPVSYGTLGTCNWLGLPGNPLSAFVTWQVFGAALLRQLNGQSTCGTKRRHVVTGEAIHRKPGRCELRPASLIGFDGQGIEVAVFETATHSGQVGRLPKSDGLMVLEAETDYLPAGALVEFLPFCEN